MGWQPKTQPKGKPPADRSAVLLKDIEEQPTIDAIPIDYMRSQVDSGKWEEIITRWKEHDKTD